MSDILAGHLTLLDETVQEDPAAATLLQDEQDRLMVAATLQEALEQSIAGTDLESIERSMLAENSGLSPREIYGLAHADRAYPLTMTRVLRILRATGFTLDMSLVPVGVAA